MVLNIFILFSGFYSQIILYIILYLIIFFFYNQKSI